MRKSRMRILHFSCTANLHISFLLSAVMTYSWSSRDECHSLLRASVLSGKCHTFFKQLIRSIHDIFYIYVKFLINNWCEIKFNI